MQLRSFGKTGIEVSEVCLGTMAFGAGVAPGDARRICDAFFDRGGNFVDAANTFAAGESERILGDVLRDRRDRVVVSTKFGRTTDPGDPTACGNDRHNLRRSLEASLTRLGTDHVDVLWAHAWDPSTPPEELAAGLDEALRSGKTRAIGIADAPAWGITRVHGLMEALGSRIDGVLLEYGLAARDAERELLPMTDALDMTPLAWGTLSGDLLLGDPESVKQRRESSGDYYTRVRAEAAQRVHGILHTITTARGESASPAAVALAWIRATQPRVIPVLGPTTEAELHDRLRSVAITLGPAEVDALGACSAIDLGFPSEYLRDPGVLREIYGDAAAIRAR